YGSHDLEDFFLTSGLEVTAHRSLESLGVLVAQILKTCQLVDTPLVRFGCVRIEVRFLFVKDFLERIHPSLPLAHSICDAFCCCTLELGQLIVRTIRKRA